MRESKPKAIIKAMVSSKQKVKNYPIERAIALTCIAVIVRSNFLQYFFHNKK